MNLINNFAQAIQSFEGFLKPSLFYPLGSASYRNHNPGNLRYTQYTIGLGAVAKSPMGFAKFPDYQTGYNALCSFLTDCCSGKIPAYNPALGLSAFFRVYAPSSDNNNPVRYAQFIAAKMGVKVDQPIKTFLS